MVVVWFQGRSLQDRKPSLSGEFENARLCNWSSNFRLVEGSVEGRTVGRKREVDP